MRKIEKEKSVKCGSIRLGVVLTVMCLAILLLAQEPRLPETSTIEGVQTFTDPERAAKALIDAADKFDVPTLIHIFGSMNKDIVLSGEYPLDRQRAADFVSAAREKQSISVEPNGDRAFLLVGNENWPFPVPIVKHGNRWLFDAKAGRQEILYRRIGSNELAAISVCHNYVVAQKDYALRQREGYEVHQYAQRIISSPGKQDGLAWENPDGSWGGPLGEEVAQAIEQGYSSDAEPFHGYFFKVLKGQGAAAPMGQLDFVVEGLMIGGFGLAAAPAEYGETGVKSFIVSHDGVVYQKDMGPASLTEFKKMERYNPDKSWMPVRDH